MGGNSDDLAAGLFWLARAKTPGEVAGPRADAILGALGLESGAYDKIALELDALIGSLPADEFARAAKDLLGSGAHRWAPVSQRQAFAAEHFEITTDGFRRKRADGGSRERDVYAYLAAAALSRRQGGPSEGPPDERAPRRWWASGAAFVGIAALVAISVLVWSGSDEPAVTEATETEPTTPTAGGDDGSTAPADSEAEDAVVEEVAVDDAEVLVDFVATGAVDVTTFCELTLADGAIAEVTGDDPNDWECVANEQRTPVDFAEACAALFGVGVEPSNDGSGPFGWTCSTRVAHPPGECAIDPGDFDLGSNYDLAPFAAAFREAAEDDQLFGLCPSNRLHRWTAGIVQEFIEPTQPGTTIAAILAVDPASPVVLAGSAWEGFNQVAGLGAGLVGYPLGPAQESDDGSWRVMLTTGGALLSESEDGSFRWMPEVAYTYWEQLGGRDSCLGLPVTNPYNVATGFRQDLEDGNLTLDLTAGTLSESGPNCS